ncbi:hypothetical protein PR048_001254 [Dryococelus australis]|uniref:HAT C-terminal dimerisation domain-containing protein n=1 Tax=Dryococelus australis TaxID=614101 RepID=A0ABQ9II76_9NEOP|nr:hypothetical protein PR048_001254 [Dryococelus australis]
MLVSEEIWAALNIAFLRADEGEASLCHGIQRDLRTMWNYFPSVLTNFAGRTPLSDPIKIHAVSVYVVSKTYPHIQQNTAVSGGRGGVVASMLAPHLSETGSISGGVAPRFPHVGIVADDAAGWRSMAISLIQTGIFYEQESDLQKVNKNVNTNLYSNLIYKLYSRPPVAQSVDTPPFWGAGGSGLDSWSHTTQVDLNKKVYTFAYKKVNRATATKEPSLHSPREIWGKTIKRKPRIVGTSCAVLINSVWIPLLSTIAGARSRVCVPRDDKVSARAYMLRSDVTPHPTGNYSATTETLHALRVGAGEWDLWTMKLKNSKDELPKDALTALMKCEEILFPNLHILLKILATFPVTTASIERSFSTLQ